MRVAGKGRPCVFVHGGSGAGSEAIETLTGPQRQSFRFAHQRVVVMSGKHNALFQSPKEVSRALASFTCHLPQ
ncbi:MAG: hypothetical protein JWR44_3539 [Hymenobacter sp.]|nr:hypothetical protein [Hymenobacter sp.]